MASNFVCQITITSFGFRHPEGVPAAPAGALLIDLRHNLRNPADNQELRQQTGLDEDVISHVLNTPGAFETIARTANQTEALYQVNRRKNFMANVLIGCQGGRHRSVVVANEVAILLESRGYKVEIDHRDINKPVITN